MTYSEVKKMPVRHRHWFINRLVRHFEEREELRQNDSSSNNNPSESLNNLSIFENQVKSKLE
jgi:hypothetical protein